MMKLEDPKTMITARKMRALENDGGNASAGAGKKVFKPPMIDYRNQQAGGLGRRGGLRGILE
jgi:hypothetical protein